MAKAKQELKRREDVPKELTWDLEAIFATDDDWKAEFEQLQEDIPAIAKYQGRLSESAENFYSVFKLQDEISERLGKLYIYARMRTDQKTTNAYYQALQSQAENVLTLASIHMSYIVPKILTMDEAQITQFLKEKEELNVYQKTLDEINRQRPHVLSEKEEALLAEAADPMQTASQTFSMLNNADLSFPTIKNEKIGR